MFQDANIKRCDITFFPIFNFAYISIELNNYHKQKKSVLLADLGATEVQIFNASFRKFTKQ